MVRDRIRRIPWAAILAQGVAIFASVVVAFAFDRWNEAQQKAELRQTALEQFLIEIRANRARVAERLPYHRDRMMAFSELLQGPLPATFDEATSRAGYQGPLWVAFSDVAWRTAQGTNVLPLLPYELAGVLTQTYSMQEEVTRIQHEFTAVGINPASFAAGNVSGGVRSAETYFGVVVEFETILLRFQYGRAEQALEAALGSSAPPDTATYRPEYGLPPRTERPDSTEP